jgi:hypothetical protein
MLCEAPGQPTAEWALCLSAIRHESSDWTAHEALPDRPSRWFPQTTTCCSDNLMQSAISSPSSNPEVSAQENHNPKNWEIVVIKLDGGNVVDVRAAMLRCRRYPGSPAHQQHTIHHRAEFCGTLKLAACFSAIVILETPPHRSAAAKLDNAADSEVKGLAHKACVRWCRHPDCGNGVC